MAYYDVALLAADYEFARRVTACAAEQFPNRDPAMWAQENSWRMASQPGFGEAYAYALETGVENPGADESVITDAQILTAVQTIG